MRRWNYFLPALMLALVLSACAPAGTQTSPPPSEQPSQGSGPSNTEPVSNTHLTLPTIYSV